VNVIEWTLACGCLLLIRFNFGLILSQSGRGKKGVLRKRLRSARSWKEWKEAAKVMDDYLEFDVWKAVSFSPGIPDAVITSSFLLTDGRRPFL
jgi:hypothetical protein